MVPQINIDNCPQTVDDVIVKYSIKQNLPSKYKFEIVTDDNWTRISSNSVYRKSKIKDGLDGLNPEVHILGVSIDSLTPNLVFEDSQISIALHRIEYKSNLKFTIDVTNHSNAHINMNSIAFYLMNDGVFIRSIEKRHDFSLLAPQSVVRNKEFVFIESAFEIMEKDTIQQLRVVNSLNQKCPIGIAVLYNSNGVEKTLFQKKEKQMTTMIN